MDDSWSSEESGRFLLRRRVLLAPVGLCMRDVKEEHTLVHVLSAFLRAKDEFDKRERREFPQ